MTLNDHEAAQIISRGLASLPLDGRRVLVIIPDSTRTIPLPFLFKTISDHLLQRVTAVDYLVALGTHPPMSEGALLKLVGLTPEQKARDYAGVRLLNHGWQNPDALVTLGTLSEAEVDSLSGGLLHVPGGVPVRINKRVLDYDHLLVCGPVFPHEVAGFSGGNKYFFPGISGPEMIDFTHWLGALLTNFYIIGTADTPVRRAIDRAASLIPTPRHALCSVVTAEGLAALSLGTMEEAWREASKLSAELHVQYVDRPYRQVISVLPPMYDELWVGGKGMYKLEPVIADGGELIIYAPHLDEISRTHGEHIKQVGYHVRDYFAKQWDRFKHIPWGVLAHSTHVRGLGGYDAATALETPRIQVTLATGLPEHVCRAVSLGYRDPASIDVAALSGREAEGILVVPKAGETLYRLRPGS